MPEQTTLRFNRCANHAAREAVARCPSCKKDFCRECITEHKRKMLCTNCLKKLMEKKSGARNKLGMFCVVMFFCFGMFVAFYYFFAIANFLTRIPDKFHDGELIEFQ